MASFTTLLTVYVLGGVTFLPLVIISIFLVGLYTFPYRDDLDDALERAKDPLIQPGDDVTALEATIKAEKRERDKTRPHQDGDEAAGYFAVCREYTPMGINAKPIERTTLAGSTTIAAPSQSIYQTMYRGIFERKQAPSLIDNNNNNNNNNHNPISQRPKKAGNVYYVILRHGHLMLFDDEDQTEVRYVISLLLHDISIYSGGEAIPEGELFIKRNAICLSRKQDSTKGPDTRVSKPFYLFSENCSAKEDFYFSLLKNQEQVLGADTKSPRPLHFDTKNIIDLVQRLYATDDNSDTRWLNALLGRIFLSIYQTKDIEHFIREKITKKISRIKRPSFLTHITVRRIDLGESAPFITNPKLRDLTVLGECVVEADVRYTGNFQIEIGTTAKVDIGHFTREVTLVLAVVLKKVEGHVLLKIKPPPSNRVWVSFSSMPKLEMTIEPIVSSRQITWTIILNQIESRIREVFAESMVLPFWDDTPFFQTEHKKWRGGIWEDDNAVLPPLDTEAAVAQGGNVDEVEKFEQNGGGKALVKEAPTKEKSHSLPNLENTSSSPIPTPAPSPSSSLFSRRLTGKSFLSSKSSATTTSVDPKNPGLSTSKAPRTGSFSSAPIPIVSTDTTNSEVFKPSTPPEAANAASRMATLSSKIQQEQESPVSTPHGSPSRASSLRKPSSIRSVSSKEADPDETPNVPPRTDSTLTAGTTGTTSSTYSSTNPTSPMSSKISLRSNPTTSSLARGFFSRKDDSQASLASTGSGNPSATAGGDAKRKNTLAAVSNAALQARQWGLNALKRQQDNKGHEGDSTTPHIDLSQPMGRGQPLPPPGVPLPMPDKKTPTAPIPPHRRHLAPPPLLTSKDHRDGGHHAHHNQEDGAGGSPGGSGSGSSKHSPIDGNGNGGRNGSGASVGSSSSKRKIPRRPVPVPPLPKRRLASNGGDMEPMQETVLVVAAPESSEPTTPLSPQHPWNGEEDAQDTAAGPPPLPPHSASTSSAGLDILVGGTPRSVPELPPRRSADTRRSFPDLPPRRKPPALHPSIFPSSVGLTKKNKGNQHQDDKDDDATTEADGKVDQGDDEDFSGWMDGQEFEGIDVEMPPRAHVGGAGGGGSPHSHTSTIARSPHMSGRASPHGNIGGGGGGGGAALQAAKKAYTTTTI